MGTLGAVHTLPDGEGLSPSVKDVADAAAELAAPVIMVPGRGLDVGEGQAAQGEAGEECQSDAIFHAGY